MDEHEIPSPTAPPNPQLFTGGMQFELHAYKREGSVLFFVPLKPNDGQPDAEVSAASHWVLSGALDGDLRAKSVDEMLNKRSSDFDLWEGNELLNEMPGTGE